MKLNLQLCHSISKVINERKSLSIEEFNKWVKWIYNKNKNTWHEETLTWYITEAIFVFLDPKYHFLYTLNKKNWQFEINDDKIDYSI